MKILLLEDDPIRVVQFRKRLDASIGRYTLLHVDRSKDAVDELKNNTYDMIFLDHDLGGRTYVDFNSSGEDCGMRVAEYLSIYPTKIRANGPIIVHSLNGPAAMQMVELISEAIWVPFAWQKEVWEKFIKI